MICNVCRCECSTVEILVDFTNVSIWYLNSKFCFTYSCTGNCHSGRKLTKYTTATTWPHYNVVSSWQSWNVGHQHWYDVVTSLLDVSLAGLQCWTPTLVKRCHNIVKMSFGWTATLGFTDDTMVCTRFSLARIQRWYKIHTILPECFHMPTVRWIYYVMVLCVCLSISVHLSVRRHTFPHDSSKGFTAFKLKLGI